ncbi:MAG: DUF4032 domain-containing protein [Acidimicrobiia bacterium]|nr:DUF4032 domain-containing protein [Acidimicrobiia bacterium]
MSTAARTPHILTRSGDPDFVDLDWSIPISDWESDRLVDMPSGIHRHPVVFVAYREGVYAIKELPVDLAAHEYEMLRSMEDETRHMARAAGLVTRPWLSDDVEASGAVITRYVRHAFPYRELVTGTGFGERRDALLDAFAGLLVELHLGGFYWGDCSLSNILYRWDASSINAIMIDAETSRIYDQLSRGQRAEDLAIMEMNVAGEMADVALEHGASLDDADLDLGSDISARYASLWSELTKSLIVTAGDHFRIRQRIDRLHGLGFAVEDIDLIPVDDGTNVKIKVTVGGRQYHSEQLRQITGIDVSENQARTILSDLTYHEAKFGVTSETGKAVGAMRWRSTVFEPLVLRISELLPAIDAYQAYCDYLEFRLVMATERERDVSNEEAFSVWEANGFPGLKGASDDHADEDGDAVEGDAALAADGT